MSDLRVTLRLLDPRLRGWGFPRWGSALAAGLDLHACIDAPLALAPQGPPALIPAGFALAISDSNWCGLILPRSGWGHRGLVLGNAVGVIDADYEGPLLISAWNRNPDAGSSGAGIVIAPGDRIAQLVLTRVTRPAVSLVDAFDDPRAPADPGGEESRRGSGGFGSTGSR